MSTAVPIPPARHRVISRIVETLAAKRRIVLTTHVNADGDGAGSEAAVAAWLTAAGKEPVIVNPTPFPEAFRFLLDDTPVTTLAEAAAAAALSAAEAFLVLDTAEPSRLGKLPRAFGDRPVIVIDHHPPSGSGVDATITLQEPDACATGELVYDLLQVALGADAVWPDAAVRGIYTAILTDTGSFRFANTSSRAHLIAADLLRRGIDTEAIYRRIFATLTPRRLEILREALATLEADPEWSIAWIAIPPETSRRLNPTTEEVEGLVEYARSIQGTEVAILFRETGDRSTKVSFRATGDVDVNRLARQFGGGGHVKASGAIVGAPLDVAKRQVLEAARKLVQETRAGATAQDEGSRP